jgi:hypothetical protein
MAAQMIRLRRFLPLFPFANPTPAVISLAATHLYAGHYEKFRSFE